MAFPSDPLTVTVDLFLDGAWTPVPEEEVRVAGGLTITRGRADEGTRADPAKCPLTFNNRDGKYSARNPMSPLYGKIGRNTAVRVTVEGHVRFTGEIASWPTRWDVSGRDVWVPVEAAGVIRRLSQGAAPLASTLYRGILRSAENLVAYWPLEDAPGSTQLASALGGPAMRVVGEPELAGFDGFRASQPIPLLKDAEFFGQVPSYDETGAVQVRFLLHVPDSGTVNGQTICRVRTTGTLRQWHVDYGTGGLLRVRGLAENSSGELAVVVDSGFVAFDINGKRLLVSLELQQVGTSVEWLVGTLEPGASTGFVFGSTATNRTLGQAQAVIMSPMGGLDDVAVGHVHVQSQITSLFAQGQQLRAYHGERAGDRMARLLAEEGVPFSYVGSLASTAAMGPQTPETLMELLTEAAEADGGILHEDRTTLGLTYVTRSSLYNTAPMLELDYGAGHVSPPLDPVEDDQGTRNDITVQRAEGSTARAVRETGPLSVQPPPAGVGRYDEQVTLNLDSDVGLGDVASWRLHLGTWDEARYPQITVDLAKNPALIGDLVVIDSGDHVQLQNLPAWIPPGDVDLTAMGYTEHIGPFTWEVTFNCVPRGPYRVGVYGTHRYGTAGSVLAAGVSAGATALSVTTTLGPRWTTDVADFPLNVQVGGEIMTVTGISGTGTTQTFTVVRAVNGVSKAHDAGAAVALLDLAIRAL